MGTVLPFTFTALGIVSVGCALAASAPPKWGLGELVLLTALIVLVREFVRLRSKSPFTCNAAWAAESPDSARDVNSEDFGPGNFEEAASSGQQTAGELKRPASGNVGVE